MRIGLYDSLDTSRLNQYRPRIGNYGAQAIEAAEVIRGAANYEPYIFAFPDPMNATIPARGTYDGRVKMLPGTYINFLSASSSQAEGFKVQIIDLGTGQAFWSKPIRYQNMSGQGSASGVSSPLYVLPIPKLIIEPGIVAVSIQNLSPNQNNVQLCLHTSQPAFWRPV